MLTLAGFLGTNETRCGISLGYISNLNKRELFITGLRVSAISEGVDISASILGKVKTVVQMVAIGFLLMRWSGGETTLMDFQ